MAGNFTFNPLQNAVSLLGEWGFFTVLLPMLLVFLIFYAILTKTQILGDSTENPAIKIINIIISLVVGFLFITETGLVAAMNSIIPSVSLMMVITLLVLMMMAFLGIYKKDGDGLIDGDKKWTKLAWVIFIPMALIFLGILDASGIYIPVIHGIRAAVMGGSLGPMALDQEAINMGVAILIFVGIPLGIIIAIAKMTKSDTPKIK